MVPSDVFPGCRCIRGGLVRIRSQSHSHVTHMEIQNSLRRTAVAVLATVCVAACVQAADAKPKYTIKQIMKDLHKGDDAPSKKVMKGEGTPADLKKFVEYYTSLPLQDPPKGDAKEWKERATKLLNATKALEAGKPGALEEFKKAVNCKACHTAHKGE